MMLTIHVTFQLQENPQLVITVSLLERGVQRLLMKCESCVDCALVQNQSFKGKPPLISIPVAGTEVPRIIPQGCHHSTCYIAMTLSYH